MPAQRKSHRAAIVALIIVGALLLVGVGGGAAYLLTKRSQTSDGQALVVQTEPLSSSTDPFAPPGSAGTDTPVTPVETDSSVQVKGGKPGLYGGTLNATQCDKGKLTDFLETNPDKGRAWATVEGIPQSEIRSFVAKLTSLILRSDTLVVNHGYVDGRATEFRSVLQAGTAVLVNEFGLPVVKCYCGNPLTAPPSDPGPVIYRGPTWPRWRPGSITVIQSNVTVIQTITVINIINNQPFSRPTGSDGSQDTPTTMPSETPGPESPAPTDDNYTADQAYEQFLQAIDRCVRQLGGSSFNELRQNPGKYQVSTTPTGQGAGLFTVSITTKSDGATYRFTVNVPARTIVPANEAAAGVGELCPQLDSG